MKKVGLIGARGYTGGELIKLVEGHSGFELVALSSRQLAGQKASDHFSTMSDLVIENLSPSGIKDRDVDAWVLALPNGLSAPWVDALDSEQVIVDLSSDHRFDDAWVHGFSERNHAAIAATKRIANPGCYATGMMATLAPIIHLLDGSPSVFGISGYSGAGTKPSPNNDPEVLRDNVIPYVPTQHMHEKEVSRHLGHRVDFMPHVASFFRGITLTLSLPLTEGYGIEDVRAAIEDSYREHPLICVSDETPKVRDNVGQHTLTIGGFGAKNAMDRERRRLVLNTTLDNLLKGAATQALQNLNLTCGFEMNRGIA